MLYVPKSTFFMGVLEVKVYYISNCFATVVCFNKGKSLGNSVVFP